MTILLVDESNATEGLTGETSSKITGVPKLIDVPLTVPTIAVDLLVLFFRYAATTLPFVESNPIPILSTL